MLLGALLALMVAAAVPLGGALGDWYSALGTRARTGRSIDSASLGGGMGADDGVSAGDDAQSVKSGKSDKSNCSDTGAAASKGKCR